jgi:hypothetical protein
MIRGRTALLALTAAAVSSVPAHKHGGLARQSAGRVLVRGTGIYDAMSHRLLLASLYAGIADDTGTVGHASPQPMVTITSAARRMSWSSGLG